MVDAPDLKSVGIISRVGSSPTTRTKLWNGVNHVKNSEAFCEYGEMVNTLVLETSAERLGGSSPSTRTNLLLILDWNEYHRPKVCFEGSNPSRSAKS